jgi:hypothetical protein
MNKEPNQTHKPLIYLTPDVLMYVAEKGSGILIYRDFSNGVNAKTTNSNPDDQKYNTINQDGISIFWDTTIQFGNDNQIIIELRKGLFFTSLIVKIEPVTRGAGFMGTRGCR